MAQDTNTQEAVELLEQMIARHSTQFSCSLHSSADTLTPKQNLETSIMRPVGNSSSGTALAFVEVPIPS